MMHPPDREGMVTNWLSYFVDRLKSEKIDCSKMAKKITALLLSQFAMTQTRHFRLLGVGP